jgi:putative endonuclease
MFYTYILRSINNPTQRYIGSTSDLRQRLKDHNSNKVRHTSKYSPWEIEWYCAFKTKEKALNFERYLKSGSGHAFAKRHF